MRSVWSSYIVIKNFALKAQFHSWRRRNGKHRCAVANSAGSTLMVKRAAAISFVDDVFGSFY